MRHSSLVAALLGAAATMFSRRAHATPGGNYHASNAHKSRHRPAGSKLARMAAEGRLTLKGQGPKK